MSRTQPVTYAGRGFWAYDVALGILLKYLIDAAQVSGEADTPWLREAISCWRVWAVITDFGLPLDEHWSKDQRETFISLVKQACAAVSTRDFISADEIASWAFVDDRRIFPRGAKGVTTSPVVELGCAIIALVSGDLPEAPKGEAWFYGTPSGRSTIQMESSWNGRWSR